MAQSPQDPAPQAESSPTPSAPTPSAPTPSASTPSSLDRSKWVAIATGVISIVLAIAYLIVVQLLDLRGPMVPAPQDLGML